MRLEKQAAKGLPCPDFGYRPAQIPAARRRAELVISGAFSLGRLPLARWLAARIPLAVLGPAFNLLRKSWKKVSKPTKRRGLAEVEFVLTPDGERLAEIKAAGEEMK